MITHASSGLRNIGLDPGPLPSSPSLLPVPSHFDPNDVFEIYPVDDDQLGPLAHQWGRDNGVTPAASDKYRVCFLVIDGQVTFSHPDMPLFVTGETGLGAAEDTIRAARYVYQNCRYITEVHCTLDTHYRHAIFHQDFWVGPNGEMPAPYSIITSDMVLGGQWRVSDEAVWAFAKNMGATNLMRRHTIEYTQALEVAGRYPLIIWPQHAKLGNVEHALMPMLYEAAEWHSVARGTDNVYTIKGSLNPFEQYSAASLEVKGTCLMHPAESTELLDTLMKFDMVIACGEAASHCFAWTVSDLLEMAAKGGKDLASRFVILTDCTSSVVIRDQNTGQVIPCSPTSPTDFRPMAADAFARFQAAGMRLTTSQIPIPGYGTRS
jgi:nicotinamidase-related amidase